MRWHRRYIVVFSCKVYHIVGPIQEHTLGDKGTLEDEERQLRTPIVLQWASVTIGDRST